MPQRGAPDEGLLSSEDMGALVERDGLEAVARQFVPGLAASPLGALVLALQWFDETSLGRFLAAVLPFLVAQVVLSTLSIRYLRASPPRSPEASDRFRRQIIAGCAVYGASWAVPPFAVPPAARIDQIWLQHLLVTVAMLSIVGMMLSAQRRAHLALTWAAIVPVSAILLAQDTAITRAWALGLVLFGGLMSVYAQRANATLMDALHLRRTSENLADRLAASESVAHGIVDHASEAIWIIDDEGLVRTANPASVRLVELDAEYQVGRRLQDLFTLPLGDGETALRALNGDRIPVLMSISPAGDGLRTVMVRDITERKRFERQLRKAAETDALTGLLNRPAILHRVERAARTAETSGHTWAVAFVDLDGFKSVNDSLGHAAGDALLVEVGRRLTGTSRPTDVVGRLGGDEFVVLFTRLAGPDEADPRAAELVAAVSAPFELSFGVANISASVGVAVSSDGAVGEGEATALVDLADAAMYRAKQAGRNRTVIELVQIPANSVPAQDTAQSAA